MCEGDVVDLIVEDLEAPLHAADDGAEEDLLASRSEHPLAKVDIIVV